MNTEYNYFIGSQTGSGKTLTYLLPIFQHIKQQELSLNELEDDFSPKSKQKNVPKLEHMQEKYHYQFMDKPPSNKVSYKKARNARVTMANRPRALIILPSKELVEQVTAEAKLISNHCKMSILGLGVAGKMNSKDNGKRGDGGVKGLFKREREALDAGVDIVIGTMSR
jgi:superfamily II DNA/RNA helicase